MSLRTLVLPSPFLPADAYDPLRSALAELGWPTAIADAGRPGSGDALVRRWTESVIGEPPGLLVCHSNAGLLAAVLRERAGIDPATVYVDAALPPASGSFLMAPPALRDELADLADPDGMLPPWTRWWPAGSLDDVVPEDARAELDRRCPQVSLDYLDSELVAPEGWTDAPQAYLAFGDTYGPELAMARDRGWPSQRLDGQHLHVLVEPDTVARAVLDLLAQLPVDSTG